MVNNLTNEKDQALSSLALEQNKTDVLIQEKWSASTRVDQLEVKVQEMDEKLSQMKINFKVSYIFALFSFDFILSDFWPYFLTQDVQDEKTLLEIELILLKDKQEESIKAKWRCSNKLLHVNQELGFWIATGIQS